MRDSESTPDKGAAVSAPKARPGRPRSQETEAAILKATSEFLAHQSLNDITVDAIAAKAGVSKATVYKWWPNKYYLALDALMRLITHSIEVADTGDVEGDFLAQLTATCEFYRSPAATTFKQLLSATQDDAAFRDLFLNRFINRRHEVVSIICQRAIARGELRADIDTALLLDMMYGPVVYRFMTGHATVEDADLVAIVQTILRGLK